MTEAASSQDAFAQVAHGADERRERIRLETPRHRIEGTILLAADGYRSRVSDVLNASERDFLTLTDATLQPLDGGPVERHEFLAVARAHVVYVVAPGDGTRAS
ncbi:MAG TPA: hypothetical protein VGY30_02075 [Solirubrobacteraceae bacterium]|nr:hypothetical protein [Solirubrobacteraceae bacterium]